MHWMKGKKIISYIYVIVIYKNVIIYLFVHIKYLILVYMCVHIYVYIYTYIYTHVCTHTCVCMCIYLISSFTGNLKSDIRLGLSEEAFLEDFMSTCRDLRRNLRNAVYFIKLPTGEME